MITVLIFLLIMLGLAYWSWARTNRFGPPRYECDVCFGKGFIVEHGNHIKCWQCRGTGTVVDELT